MSPIGAPRLHLPNKVHKFKLRPYRNRQGASASSHVLLEHRPGFGLKATPCSVSTRRFECCAYSATLPWSHYLPSRPPPAQTIRQIALSLAGRSVRPVVLSRARRSAASRARPATITAITATDEA